MCIIYVLYTLYTCLPENQDVQVLKFGKFSFHRIVTTWVLDFKCFLLDRERNRIMDLGLRTKKEEALTKGSRHFKEWLNHTPGTRHDLCNKKTRISTTRKPGYHSFRTSVTRKPGRTSVTRKPGYHSFTGVPCKLPQVQQIQISLNCHHMDFR